MLSFPPGQLLASIILAVVLAFCCPGPRLLAPPFTLLGLVPIAAGIALNLAAAAALKCHATTIKPFAESSALVTDGVFGLTRNPIYLGMILILCGTALLLGAATPWAVCLGFAAQLHFRFVLAEEQMLAARFGEAWLDYAARVRRWV
jgi:protein-S-isoprenylcysteine O-methyltransferase Ste14